MPTKQPDKQPLPVASCLLFDESGHILLLKRQAAKQGGGLWAVPGGKIEPAEDAATTMRREVFEESGLQLDNADFLGVHELRMPHGVVHMTTFKATTPSTVVAIKPDEHSAFGWFAPQQLLTTPRIIWGLPSTLRDFGLMPDFGADPTLRDGSQIILLEDYVS